MNTSHISGWVQGATELRVTRDGRRILNFVIAIDGPGPKEPYVPVAYILAPDESLNIEPGDRVFVTGPLRHHRARGLFVGVDEIMILRRDERDSRHAARTATANEGGTEGAIVVES